MVKRDNLFRLGSWACVIISDVLNSVTIIDPMTGTLLLPGNIILDSQQAMIRNRQARKFN